MGLERRAKSHKSRAGIGRTSTLYFDRRNRMAGANDEIHFDTAVAPIEQFALPCRRRIGQMGAYCGLDEVTPVLMIRSGLFQREARLSRHQRRIEDLQLRTRGSLPNRLSGELLQPTDHSRPGQ